MANFYKPVTRKYFEDHSKDCQLKIGVFIARGEWADGHLAYSRLDADGNEIDGEECAYVQMIAPFEQSDGSYKMQFYMQRV